MMPGKSTFLFLLLATVIYLAGTACTTPKHSSHAGSYKPDDMALYDTVLHLDSVFFAAYNTCDIHLAQYAAFYADSVEFYHDKGGLTTSKAELVESTRLNVCGKVTRELVKGSVEVYPIRGYGAVEMGYHRFRNKVTKETSRPGRFVVVWHQASRGWLITRVISLH